MYKNFKIAFYTHDAIAIIFGILSMLSIIIGIGVSFDTSIFEEYKIFALNVAYLIGLVGNLIIIFLVYKTKYEPLNGDVSSGINFILVLTVLGYCFINFMVFGLLMLAMAASTIVRLCEHISNREFGWDFARILEKRFDK